MAESLTLSVLRAVVVAWVLSLVGCRLAIAAARRKELGGRSAKRRGSSPTLPVLGGAVFALAAAITLAWCLGSTAIYSTGPWCAWLLASAWLVVLGMIDDLLWELSPQVKAVGQVVAALIVVQGGIRMQVQVLEPWVNALLTVVWLVAMTNAINLLDIVDGLAATVAAVAAAAFVVLAGWAGQGLFALIGASLVGALGGFLMFNWPPARLYMGNAGSHWLGFTLGTLALAISYAPAGRDVALFTPLVVLGLPVFDLAFVVLMRLRKGRSPFKKSRDHFALRLLATGHDARRTTLAMGGVAVGFAAAGLFVVRASNTAGAMTVAAMVVLVVIWGARLSRLSMHG